MEQSGHWWTTETMQWLRGPARLEGGILVLPLAEAEQHTPSRDDAEQVLFDLAAIRRPIEAVRFVARYGVLNSGSFSAEQFETFRSAAGAPHVSEAFLEWEREARDLSKILGAYTRVRLAAAGDAEALTQIRSVWRTIPSAGTDGGNDLSDRELLIAMSNWIARTISIGTSVRTWVLAETDPRQLGTKGRPGHFILSGVAPTIREYARHRLMMLITAGQPVGTCAECGSSFRVVDARQRYCTSTCARRVRNRRWLKKSQQAALA